MSSFSKAKEPGKPTVFLVQENPYINVLGASDYGDIVVLFESGQQIMFSPQPAIRKLKRKLKLKSLIFVLMKLSGLTIKL